MAKKGKSGGLLGREKKVAKSPLFSSPIRKQTGMPKNPPGKSASRPSSNEY